jgi:protein gp37
MPSLLWVADMSELLLPERPKWALDRTIGTLVISDHIGLILTKCPDQLAAYINAQPAFVQERWRLKLWLGFSAERQQEFDQRWPVMRDFAERGWLVFVSIAPMIEPVTLPDDFLSLGKWVICSGEQAPRAHVRPMKASWARRVRDQCINDATVPIPFFMKQVAGKKPVKPDLLIFRQFPCFCSKPGGENCTRAKGREAASGVARLSAMSAFGQTGH